MALNPITFTERVVDDFLHYQLTTYPLADTDLYAQLRTLLQLEDTRDTPLRQGPFVSLSKPFKQGATVERLIQEGVFHPKMKHLVPYPSVRAHQDEAIRSVHRGDTTLVSTGTGSGKTESFLYPIISHCLDLQDQGAPPGVAAVLIYPMNALAEDQLDRLRGLLAGTGIPFGMYVGKTPEDEAKVTGERIPAGSTGAAYRERVKQSRAEGSTTTWLPQEECASRASMREAGGQPRILLTNVKQLELLLTRGKDVGIFEGAPLRFLVFDEAHTFRGAQGAETACLIRRLRTFCGRSAKHVRHIATSATMADPNGGDDAAQAFGRRFFGVDGDRVTVVREAYDELRWAVDRHTPPLPAEDPNQLLNELLVAVDLDDEADVAPAISRPLVALGGAALPNTGWQAALAGQLAANELVFQLTELLGKPMALGDLTESLGERLGRPVEPAEVMAWLALGAATGRGEVHDPMLRPVVHSFVRGVGGAVVTFSNPAARLWLSGEDADAGLDTTYKRFPLLTCTTCGQHYYEAWVQDFKLPNGKKAGPEGGVGSGAERIWEFLPEEDGGDRVLLLDRLVVQPDGDDDDESQVIPSGHGFDHRRLFPLYVCSQCGTLHERHAAACCACRTPNRLVAVQAVRSKDDKPGLLHSCVACRAPGRRPRGGTYREPARPVRAVGVSDVHVLAQSMMHLSERPRLLVFADNRQDAAFQAGWMTDHARRFRLRALMVQHIPETGIAVGDLVHLLSDQLDKDEPLSRALLPEVWQVADKNRSPVKHGKEVQYFLRVQVLRELATGVRQRFGLEPWGRIRVDYLGLDESLGFVQDWAPPLNTTPEFLIEGIRALLDQLRRSRLLKDDATKVFQTYWNNGDKELQKGYVPSFPGGPVGMKLSRAPSDDKNRVSQWIGSRPTLVWNVVKSWGVQEKQLDRFLTDLWEELRRHKLVVKSQLRSWGKAMKGSAGVQQLDSGKLRVFANRGWYRCEKCRRTSVRSGPTMVCMGWNCGGRLVWETENPDNFDLRMLDGQYTMLRVAEHSAQVPHGIREKIETRFKGDGEQLNTLVCTPTLELGVDIGSLDAVLMRNVPPTAANYWQRAGRAGRRHRMAVDITYAQARGFDQAYFREPLKLLGGQVEPPRFNLKNAVMIRKHVHATVLTTLLAHARTLDGEARGDVESVVQRCFPTRLNGYLFTPGGEVRDQVLDVSELGTLIESLRGVVVPAVIRAFSNSWPDEDVEAVRSDLIEDLIFSMHKALTAVIRRFKRRLDWALGELRRLGDEKVKKGELDPEDKAQERRCERIVGRLKGRWKRGRSGSQGGAMDSNTMAALAREGFLPGYGLESGSLVGTAEPPIMTQGLDDFDLPRPPTIALREYVPGNAIYANGFRFVPRRYQLSADDVLRFRVSIQEQVVTEAGRDRETAPLSEQEIRAVPVCDVSMPSQSQISDEEDFRFQMSVATYASDKGYHRGGEAWSWGDLDLRFRRGLQLRIVNVGPRREVQQTRLGYPLCLVCGQSHSPFASKKSRKDFEERHLERCKHAVQPTGFYADVEVDVFGIHEARDRQMAFSFMESLRMGAAKVLDMEIEDLQLLALGHAGQDRVDVFLYDPMPGGSGLLEHLTDRWEEVRAAALELVEQCPSACETACIDCLQTYRNRFYHEFLDRHEAAQVWNGATGPLVPVRTIPENTRRTSTTAGQPQTYIEDRFKELLSRAGMPDPICQQTIHLGGGRKTIPDFFFPCEDEDEPGVCVFLDGMSADIHGNDEQAAKDEFLRAKLRELDYEVVTIRSSELDDPNAIVRHIAKIAKYVVGAKKSRALKRDRSWLDAGSPATKGRPRLRLVACDEGEAGAVPAFDLKIAAGAFSMGQSPDAISHVRVEDGPAKSGLFVAQVVGDSMDKVAPKGAWCLWQNLRAANASGPASGEDLVVRREDGLDSELGQFTFKRLAESETGRRLVPVSTNPTHRPIPVSDELEAVARFVAVLDGALG